MCDFFFDFVFSEGPPFFNQFEAQQLQNTDGPLESFRNTFFIILIRTILTKSLTIVSRHFFYLG